MKSKKDLGINQVLFATKPPYSIIAQSKAVGGLSAVYEWLDSHAGDYGFCQVYSDKSESNRTGYSEEPWHWSYMPLAKKFLEAYVQSIDYKNIKGFEGSELAEPLQMIKRYVKGINTTCQ